MVVNLKEHTARITQISMFNDDAHILTASRDKSFLCWDLRREKRIAAHVQRMGGINGCVIYEFRAPSRLTVLVEYLSRRIRQL